MDEFAKLPPAEKKPYFEKAADEASLAEHIIEKDFWVCWTLKRLFTHPTLTDQLIFKGGTSLSKVFQIIDRFSEDIDISISKELLGFGGSKDPEKSKGSKQIKNSIEDLSTACKEFVQTRLKSELYILGESNNPACLRSLPRCQSSSRAPITPLL